MTLRLEMWQVLLIVTTVIADAALAIRTWRKARRDERRIAMLRALAEDHAAYVPDELLGSPKRATFEMASGYWSRMLLREIDHPDPNAVMSGRGR